MFHVNGNTNKGSTIFNRRPRGSLHIIAIVFLLTCLVYVLYSNNTLQLQLTEIELKLQKSQSSISSMQDKLSDVENESRSLKNKLKAEEVKCKEILAALELQKDDLSDELKQCHLDLEDETNRKTGVETRLDDMNEELNDALAKKNAIEVLHEQLVQASQEKDGHINALEANIESLKSELREKSEELAKNLDEAALNDIQNSAPNAKKVDAVDRDAALHQLMQIHEMQGQMAKESAENLEKLTGLGESNVPTTAPPIVGEQDAETDRSNSPRAGGEEKEVEDMREGEAEDFQAATTINLPGREEKPLTLTLDEHETVDEMQPEVLQGQEGNDWVTENPAAALHPDHAEDEELGANETKLSFEAGHEGVNPEDRPIGGELNEMERPDNEEMTPDEQPGGQNTFQEVQAGHDDNGELQENHSDIEEDVLNAVPMDDEEGKFEDTRTEEIINVDEDERENSIIRELV